MDSSEASQYFRNKDDSIWAGNPTDTIESIMDDFGDEIKRLVYTYVKNSADADDVTQEVFLTVYRKLSTFKGNSSLRSWIYSIAINKSKDHLRSWKMRNQKLKDKLSQADYPSFTNDNPEEYAVRKTDSSELLDQVLLLPIKYREVIILYYFKEFSIKEIADSIGEKENTVKTRLNRGRDKLKGLYEVRS